MHGKCVIFVFPLESVLTTVCICCHNIIVLPCIITYAGMVTNNLY